MAQLPEGYSVIRITPDVFQYAYLPSEDRQTLHIAKGQYIVVETGDRGYSFCMDTIASSQSGAISRFLANNPQ